MPELTTDPDFTPANACGRKHRLACGCRITPADIAARFAHHKWLQTHELAELLADLNMGNSITGMPAGARWDRALAHCSPPDSSGHVYWTGPRPKSGSLPKVMVEGVRMNAVHFLMRTHGYIEGVALLPIERNLAVCYDTQCIAPAHWKAQATPNKAVVTDNHPLVARMLVSRPQERFRRVLSSSRPDAMFECPAGHPLKLPAYVSGAYYCPDCHQRLKAWRVALRDLKQRIWDGRLSAEERAAMRMHQSQPEPTGEAVDFDPAAYSLDDAMRDLGLSQPTHSGS